MNKPGLHPYLVISSGLFTVVAFLHLRRVQEGWDFQFGPYAIPKWTSYAAVGVAVSMAAIGLALACPCCCGRKEDKQA